jgi:hypothetical protein
MIERPAGDLVLASEPDALLALRVGKEAVEGANPAGVAGDAVAKVRLARLEVKSSYFCTCAIISGFPLFPRSRVSDASFAS